MDAEERELQRRIEEESFVLAVVELQLLDGPFEAGNLRKLGRLSTLQVAQNVMLAMLRAVHGVAFVPLHFLQNQLDRAIRRTEFLSARPKAGSTLVITGAFRLR